MLYSIVLPNERYNSVMKMTLVLALMMRGGEFVKLKCIHVAASLSVLRAEVE